MSRIGKKPVEFPAGVTIKIGTDNVITVKGPKGELNQAVDRDIKFDLKGCYRRLYQTIRISRGRF